MLQAERIEQIEILDAEYAVVVGRFGAGNRVEQPADGGRLGDDFAVLASDTPTSCRPERICRVLRASVSYGLMRPWYASGSLPNS